MTLSNYPLVELDRYHEGFTEDIDAKKLATLHRKVDFTVKLLVEDLDL